MEDHPLLGKMPCSLGKPTGSRALLLGLLQLLAYMLLFLFVCGLLRVELSRLVLCTPNLNTSMALAVPGAYSHISVSLKLEPGRSVDHPVPSLEALSGPRTPVLASEGSSRLCAWLHHVACNCQTGPACSLAVPPAGCHPSCSQTASRRFLHASWTSRSLVSPLMKQFAEQMGYQM